MSHSFPSLQAHPTLTPNPTFQPQPVAALSMSASDTHNHNHTQTPTQTQSSSSSPPPSLPSQAQNDIHIHPTPFHTQTQTHTLHHTSPLQFITGTAPIALHSATYPPPLTPDNDIVSEGVNDVNASTSNDESNSTTQSNNQRHSKTDEVHNHHHHHSSSNSTTQPAPQAHQPPFPLYSTTTDDRLQPPNHLLNAFQSPFHNMQSSSSTENDTKNGSNNSSNGNSHHHLHHPNNTFTQYFMHSPFMPQSNYAPPPPLPPSQHNHPSSFAGPHPHSVHALQAHNENDSVTHTEPKTENSNNSSVSNSHGHNNNNRIGWQFALLPQQMSGMGNPMFGPAAHAAAAASTYLPSDYMRRDGEQGMVDVPHALHNEHHPHAHHHHLIHPGFNNLVSAPIALHHNHNHNHHQFDGAPLNATNIEVSDMVDVPPAITAKEKRVTKRRRKRSEKQNNADEDSTHNNNNNNNTSANNSSTQKRKRRKSRTSSSSSSAASSLSAQSSVAVAVAALKQQDTENAVKGGAGNGYRMVLEEPVNKSMLSCHQCKNKKTLDRIIVCGHVYRINNTVKTCTKKYCKSCLLRFYLEAPPTDNKDPQWSAWKCPCCRYICCCAWCRKKKAKRLESVSKSIRAEAHRLTPAISLARKLVSESRVNGHSNSNRTHKNQKHNIDDVDDADTI